jgi:hypothetical protein
VTPFIAMIPCPGPGKTRLFFLLGGLWLHDEDLERPGSDLPFLPRREGQPNCGVADFNSLRGPHGAVKEAPSASPAEYHRHPLPWLPFRCGRELDLCDGLEFLGDILECEAGKRPVPKSWRPYVDVKLLLPPPL